MNYQNNLQSEVNDDRPIWSYKDLVVISIGCGVIFGVLFYLFIWVSGPEQLDSVTSSGPTAIQSLGMAAIEAITLISGVYLFGLRRKQSGWSVIVLGSIIARWLLAAILISFIVIPVSGIITLLVMLGLGLPLDNPQLDFIIPMDFNWLSGIGLFILAGVLVPIAEEVFFRGVIYRWLREKWGIFIGVIISSMIFGIIHFDIAIGVTAFVLGIILALVYEYSKSLWTAIIIHAINNSVKILVIYLLLALDIPFL